MGNEAVYDSCALRVVDYELVGLRPVMTPLFAILWFCVPSPVD